MSDAFWLVLLRRISLVCNALGLVMAILFLFGPRAFIGISNLVDKARATIDVEKVLATKARLTLGITLLVITALMLLLVMNIKV